MAKYYPGPGTRPQQPSDVKAMYVPVWFIDGEVTGKVTKSGTKVRKVEIARAGYCFTLG